MTTLQIQQVFGSDYGLCGPFTLDLGGGAFIEVEEVLRYLPGKRIACRAQWKGKKVFAKLFFRKTASDGHLREQQGYSLLKQKNIKTAELLEIYINAQCQIVFYELLAGKTFSVRKNDNDQKLNSIDIMQSFKFIAALHNAGLIHNDLHINNLFFSNSELYLLDVGSVTKSVSELEKTENFALFIAQFPLCDHRELVLQKSCYEETRNINLPEPPLTEAVKQNWAQRKKQYLKKIFRNCSEIYATKNKDKYLLVKRSLLTPSLMKVLENPDEAMARGTFLKDGNAQTVIKIVVDGLPLAIKRYNQKTFWNLAKRKLGINRARNCWRSAHLLGMVGIQTPSPVAIVEETKGAIYYICTHANGEKFLQYYKDNKNIDEYTKPLKTLFDVMHLGRIAHGDLKASNILVNNKELCVIDLDAMTENAFNYDYRQKKDINRFLKNFQGTDTFIKTKNDLNF